MKRIILLLSLFVSLVSTHATSIKVSSLADDGPGTLRDALFRADTSLGTSFEVDSIVFQVSGTIVLDTTLDVGNITVVGLGVDATTLDGANFNGPIMRFKNPFGEQEPCIECFENRPLTPFGVVVRDLTFENSYSSTVGGAGYVEESAYVDFINVNFLNNSAELLGGAVAVSDYGRATFDSCYFNKNNVLEGVGGAIGTEYYGDLDIKNSVFEENTSKMAGGAVYTYEGGYLSLTKTTFKNNVSDEGGALGLESSYSSNNISQCLFEGNQANLNGGAISVMISNADININSTSFISNKATMDGGALSCASYANSYITNSTFSDNSASGSGGAIYHFEGEITLKFVTIANNNSANGSGTYTGGLSNMTIENTVIAANNGGDDVFYDSGEGGINSNGYNFVGITEYTINPNVGDSFGSNALPLDPMLSPLADNGGYSFTHEPMLGSPLVNKIPGSSIFETNDQRETIFARVADTDADIGAIEYQCDHIVDLTADGTECGTLREAIEYANGNSGEDVIAFNLPQGSTITLMDSILITDRLSMYGHVYDFDTEQVVDTSRIGIAAGTAGISGLVVDGGNTAFTEIANFNFQGFDGAALTIQNTYAVTAFSNTFGSILLDPTVAGIKNNIGVKVLISSEIAVGYRGGNNAPFTFEGGENYFNGNDIGMFTDAFVDDGIINYQDIFTCNGVGIESPISQPVIDTIFQGYIRGRVLSNDIINIFADTTCSKDQGLIFVGSLQAGTDGVFESYNFTFNPDYSYVVTSMEDIGEGYGSTSPFSAPVTVTPCDSIAPIADMEVCGDSLSYEITSVIPVGYTVNATDVIENAQVNIVDDTIFVQGLLEDTTMIALELYNGMSCAYYDDFLVVKYDEPTEANITSFSYLSCEDTLQVSASLPSVGVGAWGTSSGVTFDTPSNNTTVVRGINEGDSLYVKWSISNGVCPVSEDSILIQRGLNQTPEVMLSASTPVCSGDTIHFQADFNYDYDPMDYFTWYVNGVLDETAFDSLYSRPGWSDGDTVEVVYASFAVQCQTKYEDTSQVILSIPQQTLMAVDDSVSIVIGNTVSVSVLENDLIQNQVFNSLSFVEAEFFASIEGDTAILYNGVNQGRDTVEFHVFSSCGGVDTSILIVDVMNTPPVPVDSTITVLSGSSLVLDLENFFTDAEANFDVLTTNIVASTSTPGVSIITSGSLSIDFSSSPTYTGVDTLWVEGSDTQGEKDTLELIFNVSDTITSRAGADQIISDTVTTLEGNVAAGYTTFWTSNSLGVVFVDVNSPTTQVLGLNPVNSPYQLVWNISNGTKVEKDTVLITVINTVPIASDLDVSFVPGLDTIVEIKNLFSDTELNIDFNTISIEYQSNIGGSVSLINDSLSLGYSLIPSYSAIDTVQVSVSDVFGEKAIATIRLNVSEDIFVDAGADQVISETATLLSGNVAIGYASYWTSDDASVQFVDSSIATTSVTGFVPENSPYEFVWNISNGANVARDTVIVTVLNTSPTGTDVVLNIKPGVDTIVSVAGLFVDLENNEVTSTLMIASQSNSGTLYSIKNDSLVIDYSSAPFYVGVDTVTLGMTDVFNALGTINYVINISENLNADAGEDVETETPTATISAVPAPGYTTTWTSLSSGVLIADAASATTTLSNLVPRVEPYYFVWSVSNGQDIEYDTMMVLANNVAPIIDKEIEVVLDSNQQVITYDLIDLSDKNDNLVKTIRIVKPFNYIVPLSEESEIVNVDFENLTVTIDLDQSKFEAHEGILQDSLIFEVCDELGACSESVLRVVRESSFPEVTTESLGLGTSFNFMSPNGDGVNDYFIFYLDVNGKEMKIVQVNQSTGKVETGVDFYEVFNEHLSGIEVSIFNRWGDLVHDQYEDYFGGKVYSGPGIEVEDGFVWDGTNKSGDYVTPGTYFYYVILHKTDGEKEVKINGFIEVRN